MQGNRWQRQLIGDVIDVLPGDQKGRLVARRRDVKVVLTRQKQIDAKAAVLCAERLDVARFRDDVERPGCPHQRRFHGARARVYHAPCDGEPLAWALFGAAIRSIVARQRQHDGDHTRGGEDDDGQAVDTTRLEHEVEVIPVREEKRRDEGDAADSEHDGQNTHGAPRIHAAPVAG
jgi:hypothetical protein